VSDAGELQAVHAVSNEVDDDIALSQEISNHPDPCDCPRCVGFEMCHVCGRIKLDIDWCWAERRLVL